jgi:hypothetical protein
MNSTYLIAPAVALLIFFLNFQIQIAVKFAESRKGAKKEIAVILIRALAIAAFAYLTWDLVVQVQSPTPITRSSVFHISLDTAALFSGILGWALILTVNAVAQLLELMSRGADHTERLQDLVQGLVIKMTEALGYQKDMMTQVNSDIASISAKLRLDTPPKSVKALQRTETK